MAAWDSNKSTSVKCFERYWNSVGELVNSSGCSRILSLYRLLHLRKRRLESQYTNALSRFASVLDYELQRLAAEHKRELGNSDIRNRREDKTQEQTTGFESCCS